MESSCSSKNFMNLSYMKVNRPLVLKLLVAQFLWILIVGFACLLCMFLYFGSGASSSSSVADVTYTIAISLIYVTPIIFDLLRAFRSNKIQNIAKRNSYIVTLVCYLIVASYFYFSELLLS